MALILTATNVTFQARTGKLARKNGTADYDVWLGINSHRIWSGKVYGHKRAAGATALLRLIADKIEAAETLAKVMPFITSAMQNGNCFMHTAMSRAAKRMTHEVDAAIRKGICKTKNKKRSKRSSKK